MLRSWCCTWRLRAEPAGTIIDADRVLVLDKGVVGEFGHPHTLLQRSDGLLSALVAVGSGAVPNARAPVTVSRHPPPPSITQHLNRAIRCALRVGGVGTVQETGTLAAAVLRDTARRAYDTCTLPPDDA